MANPYLCYAALLMAGLDGIQNKIHPGDPMDKNLYDLPPEELSEVPTVCSSLREALESLGADYEFLLKGDVFTKDQIDSYIELKYADVARWEMTPSPVEFDMSSEEHTSELQSLMRISYAVICLKNKTNSHYKSNVTYTLISQIN